MLTAARAEVGAGHAFSSLDFLGFALRENRIDLGAANTLVTQIDSGPQILRYLRGRGISLQNLI